MVWLNWFIPLASSAEYGAPHSGAANGNTAIFLLSPAFTSLKAKLGRVDTKYCAVLCNNCLAPTCTESQRFSKKPFSIKSPSSVIAPNCGGSSAIGANNSAIFSSVIPGNTLRNSSSVSSVLPISQSDCRKAS
ncbi:hypothetical protein ES703_106267 [subsurface metagenome]